MNKSSQRFLRARLSAVAMLAASLLAGAGASPARASGGQSIAGTVRDNAGVPVGATCVIAWDDHYQRVSTTTGSDGAYLLNLPEAGSYVVQFGCDGGPWARTWWKEEANLGAADRVEVAGGDAVTGIDATLVLGGVVAGRLLSSTGAPVPNASVSVWNVRDNYYGTSSADGTYRIQGIAPGTYQVFTWSSNGPVYWHGTGMDNAERLAVASGRVYPGIDFAGVVESTGTGSISGRVDDGAGTALNGECVSAELAGVQYPSSRMAFTDASGAYRITGLAAAAYNVVFNACGGDSAHELAYYDGATSRATATAVSVADGQETTGIDGHVGPGSVIDGTITGDGDEPLAGACVQANRSDEYDAAGRYATADQNGHYRLSGITPGPYTVYVAPCGAGAEYLSQLYGAAPGDPNTADATPISVPAGADVSGIDMKLAKGGFLEGTVTGGGAAGADVCLSASSHGVAVLSSGWARTDGAGHYRLGPLAADDFDIRLNPCGPSSQSLSPEWHDDALERSKATPVSVALGQTTPLDEDLLLTGTITGTVTAAVPGPATRLCAWAQRADVTPDPVGDDISFANSGAVDSNGHFAISTLPPATYVVFFQDCSGADRYAGAWYGGADEASATRLSVGPGQTVSGIDGALALNPPEVVSVTAAGGGAGDVVAILGHRLDDVTSVHFGAAESPRITHVGSLEVDAVVPEGATGSTVDVSVTSPAGTSPTTAADQFVFDDRPAVTGVSAASGPRAGGDTVTLSGARFDGATSVRFGAHDAVFSVVNASTISATVPAGDADQPVSVAVTTPLGSNSVGAVYTYGVAPPPAPPAPSIASVSPDHGPLGGGTAVTINGSGFTGSTYVFFGSHPASFRVIDDATITAAAPAGDVAGAVNVSVTAPGGTATAPSAYRYDSPPPPPAPSVTSISPDHGPLAGGNSVTITGSGFTGAVSVLFGSHQATFTVINDATLTAIVPAGDAAGPVAVYVTNGPVGNLTGPQYTYDPPLPPPPPSPSVLGVAPSSGPTTGGTAVTITGTGLTGASAVRFGGIDAAEFTVEDDSTITAVSPAAPTAGPVEVDVTTPAGTSTAGPMFTYVVPAPTITDVTPSEGPMGGGTVVTVSGTSLGSTTELLFGDVPTQFSVIDDDTLVAAAPASAAGAGVVDVVAQNPSGASPHSDADRFEYRAAPVVESLSPNAGPTAGATPLSIHGHDLRGATSVDFGGVAVPFSMVDDTTITVRSPGGSGPVDVTVTTAGGTSNPLSFTYVGAPVVASVLPDHGATAGGTSVTLTGQALSGVTAVAFGGVPAASFTVVDDHTITAVTPVHDRGPVDVTATSVGGTATQPSGFTFVAAPVVSGMSPSSGTVLGGTAVHLYGYDFVDVQSVEMVDDTPVTGGRVPVDFHVEPDGTITFTTPSHLPATVHVIVTTAYGVSQPSLTDRFTFTVALPPL